MKMEAQGASLAIFDVWVEVYGEDESSIVCSSSPSTPAVMDVERFKITHFNASGTVLVMFS